MILSVSRRTDVPNYYSDWFYNRIREGFLLVRNPMNPHQISKISLSADMVDCIVFWTKNPAAMIARLDDIQDYTYYFQFSLTPYGKDIEPNLPDKFHTLIPTFQKLSDRIGNERVIWRYDPIMINDRYTHEYHIDSFEKIAASLEGYTRKVVISFIDMYAKIKRNMERLNIREADSDTVVQLAKKLSAIAKKHHMKIETCAEQADLEAAGITHGSCIDRNLVEKLTGRKIKAGKDKNQRKACGCIESVDVGTYNTCRNGCKYCYASFSEKRTAESIKNYDADSPLLCGMVSPNDIVTEREVAIVEKNRKY